MCGLVGFLGGPRDASASLRRCAAAIVHRGPDGFGEWHSEELPVFLGHRRLAVVDLSPAGHQPMISASNRYVIAYNGEIYNHLSLRSELEAQDAAPAWRGHSDTESLLAGFDAWGIEATITRAVGMFAFAVWDQQDRSLTLGRDRLGEKPLYYGWQGFGADAVFLFGSELKALKAHPAFQAPIDRNAIALLMRHNHVPAPWSIYQGIRKLAPASLLTVSLNQREATPRLYWDAQGVVNRGLARPFEAGPDEAVRKLEELLRDAVARQMVADVPLGAFLSGGIDSSTIVALMQAQSSRPIRTFTIGFNEAGYDEARHAKRVATHLGTAHTELYVSAREALDVIPRLPSMYCEPFADSSQIPAFLVSRLARQHVTVALSGDGGDELFGGYNRYVLGRRLWGRLLRLPVGIRRIAARMICAVSPAAWDRCLGPLQAGSRFELSAIGDKMHKGAAAMASRTSAELYRSLISLWTEPELLVLGADEPGTQIESPEQDPQVDRFVQRMMAWDLVGYLPDDVLAKVDRAAMSVSLETRVPMLDHAVVEFAWTLPLDYKLRDGIGKWPLRQLVYQYVPKELLERPKMGFGVPIDSWLRDPLRDWAEDLLSESRLRREGFLDPGLVRTRWNEHLSGRRNWQHHLWTVLMFQAWLEEQSR